MWNYYNPVDVVFAGSDSCSVVVCLEPRQILLVPDEFCVVVQWQHHCTVGGVELHLHLGNVPALLDGEGDLGGFGGGALV